jgi:hypothetical protein
MKEKMVQRNIVKKAVFTLLLVASAFIASGLAQSVKVTHHPIRFKALRAFLLESKASFAIPAGEYDIREVRELSGPALLFSMDQVSSHKSIALLTVVRVDRNENVSGKSNIIFNYQVSSLPVLEKFFISHEDGWKILSVEYKKDAGLIDTAALAK